MLYNPRDYEIELEEEEEDTQEYYDKHTDRNEYLDEGMVLLEEEGIVHDDLNEEEDYVEEEEDGTWHLPILGTIASPLIKRAYTPLAVTPVKFAVGMRLLVKRSTGDWTHAEVCTFDEFPPGGGTLVVHVGDGLRKTLTLTKQRHVSIIRVPRAPISSDERATPRNDIHDEVKGEDNVDNDFDDNYNNYPATRDMQNEAMQDHPYSQFGEYDAADSNIQQKSNFAQ